MLNLSLFRLGSQSTQTRSCARICLRVYASGNTGRHFGSEKHWFKLSRQTDIVSLKDKIVRRLHKGLSKWYPATTNGKDEVPDSAKSEKETETKKKGKVDTIVKVLPNIRKKEKIDFSKAFYDNILITPLRARTDYLLTDDDFKSLQKIKRRSPVPESEDIVVYLRKDVEKMWAFISTRQYFSMKALIWNNTVHKKNPFNTFMVNTFQVALIPALKAKAISKYGSLSNLEALQMKYRKPRKKPQGGKTTSGTNVLNKLNGIFGSGPYGVVKFAIFINGMNFLFKFCTWWITGYHSMFAESIHSLADTANQLILALGIYLSTKKPDENYPYGWLNFRHVASLISGVAIFFLGAGVSITHGVGAMFSPVVNEDCTWALCVLIGSLISEGMTLGTAYNEVRRSAKARNLSIYEYVYRSEDPTTNVVLLEDLSAVLGVVIAGGCMYMSHHGYPFLDPLGSILIGGLLIMTSVFVISSNAVVLVGKSIHPDIKLAMTKTLESDRLVRAVHDIKAINMGSNITRFKAEIDYDGREATRKYLTTIDMEQMLQEVRTFNTSEELELFMIFHGEKIVDTMGSEIDRLEKNFKKHHPEVHYIDLEQL